MKKSITLVLLGGCLCLIAGWKATIAQTPPEFTGSLMYNPVLYYGYAGSWEEYSLLQPSVIIHDGTFYMYYTGVSGNGIAAIGLATSSDGYFYEKLQGNPVLTHSEGGFDALEVSGANVIGDETGWIMYYGGRESGWGPPPFIGRATASDLSGPWTRSLLPVLTIGSPDEWDNDFISPFQVIPLDGGGYIMFYTGGDYASSINYQIGMATSADGLVWTKYDDPSTTDPPYAQSDPVLTVGDTATADWDCRLLWGGSVLVNPNGYELYYTGCDMDYLFGFGYATSPDGITWTKYPANPIYTMDNDPYAQENGFDLIVRPCVVINELKAFMYYDYGIPGMIAMATADLTGMGDQSSVGGQQPAVSIYPNPTHGFSQFLVQNAKPAQVTLKIFDVNGREVGIVMDEKIPAGEHPISYDMTDLSSGIYSYMLTATREADGGRVSVVSGKIIKY
jgi:hypothetical protein